MARLWVLVGNSSRAVVYGVESRATPPVELACYTNPAARMHERELTADLPGQSFDGKAQGQHGLPAKSSKKNQQTDIFAHDLCAMLGDALSKAQFKRLVICASPRFLGMLRHHLSGDVKSSIIATIDKNLVEEDPKSVQAQVDAALFPG